MPYRNRRNACVPPVSFAFRILEDGGLGKKRSQPLATDDVDRGTAEERGCPCMSCKSSTYADLRKRHHCAAWRRTPHRQRRTKGGEDQHALNLRQHFF